jgi:UDP-galactopyranose mutase
MSDYDYLINGASWFGAFFARETTDAVFRCLVIEKRYRVVNYADELRPSPAERVRSGRGETRG